MLSLSSQNRIHLIIFISIILLVSSYLSTWTLLRSNQFSLHFIIGLFKNHLVLPFQFLLNMTRSPLLQIHSLFIFICHIGFLRLLSILLSFDQVVYKINFLLKVYQTKQYILINRFFLVCKALVLN